MVPENQTEVEPINEHLLRWNNTSTRLISPQKNIFVQRKISQTDLYVEKVHWKDDAE